MSLSDHPPIMDKNPLVGGESILRGIEFGMEFKDEIKEKKLNYTTFLEGRVCASVVLISKMQTMKKTANPPKGDGVWALCSPLGFHY